jgi:hypothetical protein
MTILAYHCMCDCSQVPKRLKRGDIERYDAILYPWETFQGWGIAPFYTGVEPVKHWTFVDSTPYAGVEPLHFLGWPKRLPKTDFPRNSPGLPLMSKRMLEVLCSVGDFPHKAISTRIFDYDLEREIETYLTQEDLDPELCNENYVAVQLLEHSNVADLERSTFRTDIAINPPLIEELVLKEPAQGFPPLFRVERDPIHLFVSPTAKSALEEAGIKDIRYFAWDENGIRGAVYKLRDGTEHIGNDPPPPRDLMI